MFAMTQDPARRGPTSVRAGRSRPRLLRSWLLPGLVLALLAIMIAAAALGPVGLSPTRIAAALGLAAGDADPAMLDRDRLVLWSIRLPRIATAALVGSLLAAGGAVMQGLFRNPLADPALVGVASGGALAAAAVIVTGDRLLGGQNGELPAGFLPLAAFGGALGATSILYRIATRRGRTSMAVFLLAGLAVAALANAGLGLLVLLADDRQLRDVTFWLLGSLNGATWWKAAMLAPFPVALLISLPFLARGLDWLALGEAEAFHMGIDTERLKRLCIVLVSAMVGAAVSLAGIIAFLGIIVPHLLRLAVGPGHRLLLPASACLGAGLLLAADTCARTLAAPAEIPIGILTSLVGAPFFLAILLRQRDRFDQ